MAQHAAGGGLGRPVKGCFVSAEESDRWRFVKDSKTETEEPDRTPTTDSTACLPFVTFESGELWRRAFLEVRMKLLSCLVLLSLTGGELRGGTWLVSPSESIQSAIDAATPGDVVCVLPGTYAQTLNPAGKSLVIRSVAGPDQTILDGAGGLQIVNVFLGESSATVIEGFRLRNCSGRALKILASSPTIRGCVFENNSGGATSIVEIGASPRFEDCVFRNNSAISGGAVLVFANARATFDRCVFQSNASTQSGGALWSSAALQVSLSNCVLAGNQAVGNGGAVFYQGSGLGLFVVNCTVVDNNSGSSGGAIYQQFGDSSVVNTVLWGNGSELVGAAGVLSVDHCLVEGGWPGANNQSSPPAFLDRSGRDYRLRINSPAIDAGRNNAVTSGISRDVIGNPRIQAGLGTPGTSSPAIVDIGALETKRPVSVRPPRPTGTLHRP